MTYRRRAPHRGLSLVVCDPSASREAAIVFPTRRINWTTLFAIGAALPPASVEKAGSNVRALLTELSEEAKEAGRICSESQDYEGLATRGSLAKRYAKINFLLRRMPERALSAGGYLTYDSDCESHSEAKIKIETWAVTGFVVWADGMLAQESRYDTWRKDRLQAIAGCGRVFLATSSMLFTCKRRPPTGGPIWTNIFVAESAFLSAVQRGGWDYVVIERGAVLPSENSATHPAYRVASIKKRYVA